MNKISLLTISILVLMATTVLAIDNDYESYENKMKRRNEEIQKDIEFHRDMRKLELQYKIYMAELELKRDNISVNNSNRNTSDSMAENSNRIEVKQLNTERK